MKRYRFQEITRCEMCGDPAGNHAVMGQRLNRSQGFFPRRKIGIAVSVLKCRNCQLIYSSPQPIPFDIQDHYGVPPEDYWKAGYFEWTPDYFARQIREAKELLPFKSGMAALDIGAGLGKCMLSLEHAGFDSYGLEPSVPFYERAIYNLKIDSKKLQLGMLESVEFPEHSFDFITFGAVFEHLYHPAKSLEKALKWLKPSGLIHLEVPSSKYLIEKLINIYFKMRGTNYVTNLSPMHSPFHLYEFGYRSFEKLSEKLPFSIQKHYYEVCSIDFFPRFTHPLLHRVMDATDTGMQLTLYLRKKS